MIHSLINQKNDFNNIYLEFSAKQAFYMLISDDEIRQILIPKFWHRQFFEQYPSSTMNRVG